MRTGFSHAKGLTTAPLYSLTLTCSDPGRKTKITIQSLIKQPQIQGIKKIHIMSNDTKSCHAFSLHLMACSAARLCKMVKRHRTVDKEEDLLWGAQLRGISCFDTKQTLSLDVLHFMTWKMLLEQYLSRQVHYIVKWRFINPHFLPKKLKRNDKKHASPLCQEDRWNIWLARDKRRGCTSQSCKHSISF